MEKWQFPKDPGDNLFGPSNIMDFMPAEEEIPKEFWRGNTKWNKLFNDWFFNGIKDLQFDLKDDVNGEIMMKHIGAVMGSWAPQHEHKEAAVVFLFSLWCNDVKWERRKKNVRTRKTINRFRNIQEG